MLPPTRPQPAVAAPSGLAGASLKVAQAPDALAALPVGSRLSGRIAGRLAAGVIGIETDIGRVAVEARVAAAKGAVLTMTLTAQQPQPTLRVTAVNAAAKPAGGAAATDGAAKDVVTRPPAGAAAAVAGTRLSAVVAGPPQRSANAAAGPLPSHPSSPRQGAEAEARLPAPGSRLSLRTVTVSAPGALPAPGVGGVPAEGDPLAAGQRLAAQVVGGGTTGVARLATPAGELLVTGGRRMPAGASLVLEVEQVLPPILGAGTTKLPAPAAEPAPGWSGLRDLLGLLDQDRFAGAREIVENALPRPTASLAANLLAFLGVARDGDLQRLLGAPAWRSLGEAAPEVIEHLSGDLREATQGANPVRSSEWRTILIPLVTDTAIETIRLMGRRRSRDDDDEDGDEADGEESSRFVFEVRLSRLGLFQLDGFVRKTKTFELLVRTEQPLAPRIREDLRGLFAEAGALAGFGGSIGFLTKPLAFDDPGPSAVVASTILTV